MLQFFQEEQKPIEVEVEELSKVHDPEQVKSSQELEEMEGEGTVFDSGVGEE